MSFCPSMHLCAVLRYLFTSISGIACTYNLRKCIMYNNLLYLTISPQSYLSIYPSVIYYCVHTFAIYIYVYFSVYLKKGDLLRNWVAWI